MNKEKIADICFGTWPTIQSLPLSLSLFTAYVDHPHNKVPRPRQLLDHSMY